MQNTDPAFAVRFRWEYQCGLRYSQNRRSSWTAGCSSQIAT